MNLHPVPGEVENNYYSYWFHATETRISISLMVHSASVDSSFFTPGWDASPSQGYLPPSFSRPAVSVSTPTWKTDTMRVNCLA